MIANDVDVGRLTPPTLGPRLELTLVTLGDGRFQLIHCKHLGFDAEGQLRAQGKMTGRQADPAPPVTYPQPAPAPRKARPSYLKVV